jgi:PTS system nitrogen regulatory IIA component
VKLIAQILPRANVLVDVEAGSKRETFEQAGKLFEDSLQIPRAQVLESLLAREKLGSTALGHGIAIPHGRIKGLREAVGAFLKLKTPIPFDAPDGQPVVWLFILLVPAQATDLHLQILGELAQAFSNRQLREELQKSGEVARIHQLLTE